MPQDLLLFVGTLTRKAPYFQNARGNGLNVYDFDEISLNARPLARYPGIENPSFLSVTPDGSRIYANSEVYDWREGLVTALAFDRQSARLDYINTQPTLGSTTAYNLISQDGSRLYVINYVEVEGGPAQGLAVFDIRPDGGLTPVIGSVGHVGHGPNPDRQEQAHMHSVTEMGNGLLLIADLGLDQLVTYRIAPNGSLTRVAVTATAPGAGPRHVARHPAGRFVFVMNELNSTVTSHGFDPVTGVLHEIDCQSALPANCGVVNYGSDIQISPDGRFLYGGNRGHDSISVFGVDQATGQLTPLGFTPSGGSTRHMTLTPSGRHLLCANQNTDCITILARDDASGTLTDTGKTIAIGTPMCVKFAG
ncbi:MAG: lactonase family protein [bacterium]